MSLGGTYNDLYIRQYTDMIEHELQQNGSRLRDIVTIEQAMGERKYFNKIGTLGSYQRTARLEPVQLQDMTNERRLVSPIVIESAHALDFMDLIRYQRSPQPEIAQAMAKKLGRDIDTEIARALGADAARELNGSVSNAAFDSNFVVAVNDNSNAAAGISGTAMTGDTGLHEGKIITAQTKMLTAYAIEPGEELFCVAPAKQLSGLSARAFQSDSAGFFQNLPAVNGGSFDARLNGFLGNIRYIPYEGLGVDGSNDQIAYLFPKSAIKLGMWQDITFKMGERLDISSAPTQVMVNMAIGAVRMFEEKVVKILCDPTPNYA